MLINFERMPWKVQLNRLGNWIVLLLLMGLSGCAKSSASKGGQTGPPDPDPPATEKIIRVMTYNIHRGNPPGQADNVIDLEATAAVIKSQKPDLVSLNEVDVHTKRSGVSLDEAKKLGELTGMHAYFAKAMDYDGGQYGDAVLSKYPIEESFRYGLPFKVAGSEPRDIAMIKVRVEGKEILFASTHLDHLATEENRILQANTIVNDILPQLKLPLILGGDLNATPESETIRILSKQFTAGCDGKACPLSFPYNGPDRTIDYIMISSSSDFEFKSYKAVAGATASDHLPVMAEIKLK